MPARGMRDSALPHTARRLRPGAKSIHWRHGPTPGAEDVLRGWAAARPTVPTGTMTPSTEQDF